MNTDESQPEVNTGAQVDEAQTDRRKRICALLAGLPGTIRRHPKKSIAACFLLVLLLASSSSEENGAVRVHSMETVAISTLRQEFPVTGIIKPEEGAEVKTGSRFTGVIDRLHVRLGDSVKKGQVIAELDNREQEAECVRLNATIRKLRAELDMAQKTYPLQIRETQALLDSARAEHAYAQKKAAQGKQSAQGSCRLERRGRKGSSGSRCGSSSHKAAKKRQGTA